ncbi:MAG: hypothetical protein COW85_09400 [Ignavibacteria bacterium CG22_combo_CG10-13_8_21_14_all_37_15]|nr:MAG: hypothetical protein COW85_09400 [Ignavibacteria bacterium CG22_combo_CG10-13_8_21_14_all_37_15]
MIKNSTDFLKKNIFRANDDFLTANFWLRFSCETKSERELVDFYLNLITERKTNYRTDFIVARFLYEGNLSDKIIYRTGGGIALSGNYNGVVIQNSYHKIFGIRKVDLKYEENKTQFGAFYFSMKYKFYSGGRFVFRSSTSLSYLTGNGPSFFEYGASAVFNPYILTPRYQVRLHIGDITYYKKSPELSPFFAGGFLWALITTIRFFDFVNTSVWVTGNQYGIDDQNHFGIAFGFGGTSQVPLNIDDIKFP